MEGRPQCPLRSNAPLKCGRMSAFHPLQTFQPSGPWPRLDGEATAEPLGLDSARTGSEARRARFRGTAMATATTPAAKPHHDRLFYTGMGVMTLALVVAGFARTYYFSAWMTPRPGFAGMSPLLHIHGFLFTCWFVLQVVQPALIAGRQRRLHRKLGFAAVGLAPLMVALGILAGIDAVKRGSPPVMPDPRMFFTVPFFGMLTFGGIVALALVWRNRPETHKRLMLLSSATLLDAAVSRLPGVLELGPLAFFGGADLIIVAGITYDLMSRGRIHKVWIYGGLAVIASQALRLALAPTAGWLAFTDIVVGMF